MSRALVKIHRWLPIAVIAVTALSLWTCGRRSESPERHYLRIADGTGDGPTLNPHLFSEITLGHIAAMTQAYLVKYDSRNRPYPELLTVVPSQANGGISKDGKTITWHLRKGVRWSDGAAFTADDVTFSTRVVLNPANNEVRRAGWDLITKIDQPDRYTVAYHLKQPYSSYEPTFFGSVGSNPTVLPKHLLAGYPNINNIPYNSKPVGIGPFRVVDWQRGDRIDLEPNPYYFRGTPKLHRITYELIPSRDTLLTLIQTGEVDLWPDVPPSYLAQVRALVRLPTDVHPGIFYEHLDFNVRRPLVSDVRVRQAVRYALDRRQIVKKVVHGYGTLQESTISPIFAFAPVGIRFVEHDANRAKRLLEEAGWKVGPGGVRVKDGRRLTLQLAYNAGASSLDDTVEMIREELRAVGIEVQARKYVPAMFFAPYQNGGVVYGANWDMTMFAWGDLPVADVSNLFECDQIPPKGQNVLRYCNPKLDQLLEAVKRTYDQHEQARLLARETRTIVGDAPTIVLYVFDTGYTHNKRLTGFHSEAFAPFDNMQDVDI